MTDHSALIERLDDAVLHFAGSPLSLLLAEAAAALRDLTELLAGFVQDEDDARSNPLGGVSLGGLMDCRDNSGCVYQSADLAARIAKARVLTLPSAPNQAKEAGE
jgi:hypothetical protein